LLVNESLDVEEDDDDGGAHNNNNNNNKNNNDKKVLLNQRYKRNNQELHYSPFDNALIKSLICTLAAHIIERAY
jgi:hypothetical protein